jgi:hypothetical protein
MIYHNNKFICLSPKKNKHRMKSFFATLLLGFFVISTLAAENTDGSINFLDLDPELDEDAIGVFVPMQDDSISVYVPLYYDEEDQGEDTINVFVPLNEVFVANEENSIDDFIAVPEMLLHDEEEDAIGIFVPLETPESDLDQEDIIAVYVSMAEILDDSINEIEAVVEYEDEIQVFVPLDNNMELDLLMSLIDN